MGLRIKDGFCQFPTTVFILNREFNLEQVLNHLATGNKYQIKEIQDKGFIVYWVAGPLQVKSQDLTRYYISNSNLNEYI